MIFGKISKSPQFYPTLVGMRQNKTDWLGFIETAGFKEEVERFAEQNTHVLNDGFEDGLFSLVGAEMVNLEENYPTDYGDLEMFRYTVEEKVEEICRAVLEKHEDATIENGIRQREALNLCEYLNGRGVEVSIEYTMPNMEVWDAEDTENEVCSHIEFYIKGGERELQEFIEAMDYLKLPFDSDKLRNINGDKDFEEVREKWFYDSYIHNRVLGVVTIGLPFKGDFDKFLY